MRNFCIFILLLIPRLLFVDSHQSLASNLTTHQCGCTPSPKPPPPPPEPVLTFLDQRLAVVYPIIQTFKNTITSDPLGITKTWVGPDVCNYTGFYCDHPPDNETANALAAIDFNGFRLSAPTLAGFIDLLPDLALFHANTNNFTGPIPAAVSKLPYLYEFDISNNRFKGEFPTELLAAVGLTFLDIRFNSFTGTVPPALFVRNLDVLFINNNNFTQRLPPNLGALPALYLTFANNKFTGPIPRSIGNASSTLTEVLFLNNLLSGCLPYEVGFLDKTRVFDVSNNLLTGPLPWSLGCMKSAEVLSLGRNLFYGAVPEILCWLPNLGNLSLADNFFTSVGPLCRKLIRGGVLDVRRNCIWGFPDQRPYLECHFFFRHALPCPLLPSHFYFLPCKHHPFSYSSARRIGAPPATTPAVTYSALMGDAAYHD